MARISSGLESNKHISPDSRFPIIIHPNFSPKISSWTPPEPLREELTPTKDRAHFADKSKRALFAVAKRVDPTESIGTVLEDVQLSQLNETQLDELALLVNERGVVFFRDQDLTTEGQVKLFEHYSSFSQHISALAPLIPRKVNLTDILLKRINEFKHVTIKGSNADSRTDSVYTPWPQAGWHADTSFEINPPSYSLLRMEERPDVGGDTAWVSQYGLYDELSTAYKRLFESLHAVHTSRLQYDTILDLWGVGPNCPPIDTHYPALRTHPVIGWKAFNVNEGFATGFAELKKLESATMDKLLDFAIQHIQSVDDHYVRWKWEVGSVALWDNRCTIHRVIPGKSKSGSRRGVRTTVFGEKPFYNPDSKGREEATESTNGAI